MKLVSSKFSILNVIFYSNHTYILMHQHESFVLKYVVVAASLPAAAEFTWFQKFSLLSFSFTFVALIESVVSRVSELCVGIYQFQQLEPNMCYLYRALLSVPSAVGGSILLLQAVRYSGARLGHLC